MAESLLHSVLTTNLLTQKMLQMIRIKNYLLQSKKWSRVIQDQKEKPMDRAIWWIEWTMRNPKPDYLTSSAHDLGYIRANSYDIVLVLALIAIFFLMIIFEVIKLICNFSKTAADDKQKIS